MELNKFITSDQFNYYSNLKIELSKKIIKNINLIIRQILY